MVNARHAHHAAVVLLDLDHRLAFLQRRGNMEEGSFGGAFVVVDCVAPAAA